MDAPLVKSCEWEYRNLFVHTHEKGVHKMYEVQQNSGKKSFFTWMCHIDPNSNTKDSIWQRQFINKIIEIVF